MPASIAILLSRVRLPSVAAVLGLTIARRFLPVLPHGWLVWLADLALVAVLLRVGTLRREPVAVRSPVQGSWRALNSPATRVPSHGIQGYGQTYAIDLVYDPAGPVQSRRPGFAWWPLARRAQDFPGFGQPVFAPADGVVVRVHDRERDHWSRTSPLGLLYLFTIELFRELFGPSRVVGNHVIIDLGDGTYAALAHLRHRSIQVRGPARPRRRPDRRMRQLRQHHRAASALPPHGPPPHCSGRGPAIPLAYPPRRPAEHATQRHAAGRATARASQPAS